MPDDKIEFFGVGYQAVPTVWKDVEKYIKDALERTIRIRYTVEDVYNILLNRDMQLWVGYNTETKEIDCVVVTEIAVYPRLKCVRIVILTGKQSHNWLKFSSRIKEWGKAQGCSLLEGFARPGWERVLKTTKKTHVFLEEEI